MKKCVGDDCVEARKYDKELDYMQNVLHYDRVPERRSDTTLKKFSACSFRVNLSDRETGLLRTVEMRGVFLDSHVVTSAKGKEPSTFKCKCSTGCEVCAGDRTLYRYKDYEKVWRFPVHSKSTTEDLGAAFGIECEDCMKLNLDYVFEPLVEIELKVDEYVQPRLISRKRAEPFAEKPLAKKAKFVALL